MRVVPLAPEHVRALTGTLQVSQHMNYEMDAEMLPKAGDGYAGLIGEKVIFAVGAVRLWEGRYELWAMLSGDACKHMVWVTRVAKRLLQLRAGARRLEIIVKSDFKAAHRWAEMLGFRWHHHEERFLPDGSDADIYVRTA